MQFSKGGKGLKVRHRIETHGLMRKSVIRDKDGGKQGVMRMVDNKIKRGRVGPKSRKLQIIFETRTAEILAEGKVEDRPRPASSTALITCLGPGPARRTKSVLMLKVSKTVLGQSATRSRAHLDL